LVVIGTSQEAIYGNGRDQIFNSILPKTNGLQKKTIADSLKKPFECMVILCS
jgi:hypothetical protein